MKNGLMSALSVTCSVGLLLVVVLLGGAISSAVNAPLSGAVIANTTVGHGDKRKIVQRLEGGRIRAIPVRGGERVRAGDVLRDLDDARARAEAGEHRNRIRNLAAPGARLHAERARASAIAVTHPVRQDRGERAVAAVLKAQRSLPVVRAINGVDEAAPGAEASAPFVAFPPRELRRIQGRVEWVSDDARVDERTGVRF